MRDLIAKYVPRFYFELEGFDTFIKCFDEVLNKIIGDHIENFSERVSSVLVGGSVNENYNRIVVWFGDLIFDKYKAELFLFNRVTEFRGTWLGFNTIVNGFACVQYGFRRVDFAVCGSAQTGSVCGLSTSGDKNSVLLDIYGYLKGYYRYNEYDQLVDFRPIFSNLKNLESFLSRFYIPFFIVCSYRIVDYLVLKRDKYSLLDAVILRSHVFGCSSVGVFDLVGVNGNFLHSVANTLLLRYVFRSVFSVVNTLLLRYVFGSVFLFVLSARVSDQVFIIRAFSQYAFTDLLLLDLKFSSALKCDFVFLTFDLVSCEYSGFSGVGFDERFTYRIFRSLIKPR